MYGSDVNMISSGIPQVKSRGITTHEVEHFAELGWFGLVYGCLYTQVSERVSRTGAPGSQS